MPTTNGHGPKKRAILYARVSGDEQAKKGYSLPEQLEALRAHAEQEGYEVLEEVVDGAWSGAYIERPGLDHVRDLVAEGGVSVVLTRDRDRFSREPAYRWLLEREFEEHGTKIRSLNDRGDDSPEGELMDAIFDQFAKFERAKITERTRRGLLRKARGGQLVGTAPPKYGFQYNERRDGFVINEPEMLAVEKIFRLAADGLGVRAIQTRLHREGVRTRSGGKVWARAVIQRLIFDDAYKPHAFEEVSKLVTPDVAARLNPEKEYGVEWYNRQKVTTRTISEPDGNGGRHYKKRQVRTLRPKEEWVAIPVPAYLSHSLVKQARAAFEANKGFERKHLARAWELRGLLRCSCGWKMGTHTTRHKKRGDIKYHYYTCQSRKSLGSMATCTQKTLSAPKVEGTVWEFVSGIMKDPERLRTGLDAMIEEQRVAGRREPEREARVWLERIAECDRKRSGYLELAAEGLMTHDELRAKFAELQETREAAEEELAAIRHHEERIEALERDRDALLDHYESIAPEKLDALSPEERNGLYRTLGIEVTPRSEDFEITGPFCISELTRDS